MKTKYTFYLKNLTFLTAILAFTVNSYAGNGKNDKPKVNGNNGNGVGNYDGAATGNTEHGGNQGNDKPVGNTGPKKDKNNGDSIPLDGGLAILLVGAAAFGIKKLRKTQD
ncbi:PID-CTERM protein-sorting domain-containing protein [Mariniflexile sp. AS56]|uniref:PID-CTERM protein-sorting domain-containing protein n=1 Tax=Mariniflexile sp. AS56 TaxID=3063957 RepID=UPI0026F124F9|nr:hypothetical protein [Mariniflexile sp. AS56]MDO7172975.1 hypothetical protein [Mariniflexile sp. AS56]